MKVAEEAVAMECFKEAWQWRVAQEAVTMAGCGKAWQCNGRSMVMNVTKEATVTEGHGAAWQRWSQWRLVVTEGRD